VSIGAATARIQERIAAAALRSGRPAGDVRLMAAVKTRSAEEILEATRAGVTILGENRIQEGQAHLEALGERLRPTFSAHFIGRLQSNKAKKAVQLFNSIDSVDSERLAQTLSRLATDLGLSRRVMLEVNLGEESQKGGVEPAAVQALAEAVSNLPGLTLAGLMGVCPYDADPEASRPHYRKLAELFGQLQRNGPAHFDVLSMGMSHDFEVAVEEGATMVRLGEALFGPRRSP
jgi:PLP dependent protein